VTLSVADWKDMIDHYDRKGLLNAVHYDGAIDMMLEGKNPFTEQLQRFLTYQAMQKRITLSAFMDEKFEEMTTLFAQEAPLPENEKVTWETVDILEEVVTHQFYSREGIRPLIYKIRDDLDPMNWTLLEVLKIALPVLKKMEEEDS
jgi:hypothetical protein